ncbi:MAG: HlyD family efflux transporter periplasmic adaptor subunit [Phycisphaerae bacterium]
MTKRRKYIVGGMVLLFLVWIINGWYQGRKNAPSLFDKPEFTTIVRGDLDVPIIATGSVEPSSRTEIKCKASGTVMNVYFEAGDMVHKGDLLVKLDPIDENQSVETAQADAIRAKANLSLAESERQQAEQDWPTKMETAMAGLEAGRGGLQGAVVEFKRQEEMRQGSKNGEKVTMNIVKTPTVKPVALEPTEDPLVVQAGKSLTISGLETVEAARLVQSGRDVINKSTPEGYKATSPLEYQTALIQMWQYQAKLLAAMADLRNAVNLRIIIDQAKTKVILAQEAKRMAEIALSQARQRRKETEVFAPSDGLVQEVFVKKGQIISSGITTVTGGTPLMTLADVSKLFVVSDVDEADIGRVRDLAPEERSSRLGFILKTLLTPIQTTKPVLTKENEQDLALLRHANNVDITVDAFREETFTGKVDRVDPNPKNVNNIVTYNVRILLTSPNRTQLMLGMHANVKFTSQKLTNILKVANEAIKVKNEERGVYIDGPDQKPLFVPVKVGLTDSVTIELKTDKIKEGQRVYVKLPSSKEEKNKNDE